MRVSVGCKEDDHDGSEYRDGHTPGGRSQEKERSNQEKEVTESKRRRRDETDIQTMSREDNRGAKDHMIKFRSEEAKAALQPERGRKEEESNRRIRDAQEEKEDRKKARTKDDRQEERHFIKYASCRFGRCSSFCNL